MKILDMANLPFGENYKLHEKNLKSNFDKSPIFMKAEFNSAFMLKYENVEFDNFGNANITFNYIHNKLISVEVELEFFKDRFDQIKPIVNVFEEEINKKFRIYQNKQVLNSISSAVSKIENCVEKGKSDYSQNETLYSKLWFPPGIDKAKKLKRIISTGIYINSDGRTSCRALVSFEFTRLDLSLSEMSSHNGMYIETDEYAKKEIKLTETGGVYSLPVKINNNLTLDFVLDLGASDVLISQDVFSVLVKAGSIDQSDYIGEDNYQLADGTKIKSKVFNLRSLKIGELEILNVRASISNSTNSPLLFGQSALKKLGKYQIDNTSLVLIVE